MIISKRHGFIFIHVPKAGGTSVEVLLDPYLAWDDLILGSTELGHAMNRAYRARHGLFDHGSLADVAATCGAAFTNASFIFAVVRHPLDRIVSLYNFLHSLVEDHCRAVGIAGKDLRDRIASGTAQDDPDFCAWPVTRLYASEPDFSAFLAALDPAADVRAHPQVSFLSPPPGIKPIDCIIRLEEIDDVFPGVARRLGLPAVVPGRLNASSRHPVVARDVPLADRRCVAGLYADDFAAFDYSPS